MPSTKLATFCGLPVKISSGTEAIKMWNNTEFGKLKEYCARDVELTEQVYLTHKKLKEAR